MKRAQHIGNRDASSGVVAVLPARLGARRLPGKPLVMLAGEPLIWHVYRQVCKAHAIDEVLVATDAPQVVDAITQRGGQAILIHGECASGTERVARAATIRWGEPTPERLVINVQGDEPFVCPEALDRLVDCLRAGATIATLAAPLPDGALDDPHAVKVVRDATGRALYFSRAPIPGDLHLGVYGFTHEALDAVATLPRGRLASAEDLEQLAWLEAGFSIAVADAPHATLSIDTPADLAAAEHVIATAHRSPP